MESDDQSERGSDQFTAVDTRPDGDGDANAWEAGDRLARLALLLTGDPARAYRLTRTALIAVGPHATYTRARRRLVRRTRRGRLNPHTTAMLPGLGGPTPAGRLWRRLVALPVTERALVVLTEAEGLADSVAAAALGLPRGDTETTLARIRESLTTHTRLTEEERREVFGGPTLRPAPGVVAPAALRRDQRGRGPRRVAIAAAAVMVLAGATAGFALRGGDSADEPVRFSGGVVEYTDPANWPARGDLLGDHGELRDAVRTWRDAGMEPRGTAPTVVWAGRIDGGRLVVLAGQSSAGEHVLGALLDTGTGSKLVDTQPAERTLAVGLRGLDPDSPDSRRYLVAPWAGDVSVLDLNTVNNPTDVRPADGERPPITADDFTGLSLNLGLSNAWVSDGGADGCVRPLLRMSGDGDELASSGDPAGTVTDYALDVAEHSPTVEVTTPAGEPDGPDPMLAGPVLAALGGLSPCDPAVPVPGSLARGTPLSAAALLDLDVRSYWTGQAPGGAPASALRLTWRVFRQPGFEPVNAQTYAVVSEGSPVGYSMVQYAEDATDLERAVASVEWTTGDGAELVALVSGPATARVDARPRLDGFPPGDRVGFLPRPAPGTKLTGLGRNAGNEIVSANRFEY